MSCWCVAREESEHSHPQAKSRKDGHHTEFLHDSLVEEHETLFNGKESRDGKVMAGLMLIWPTLEGGLG